MEAMRIAEPPRRSRAMLIVAAGVAATSLLTAGGPADAADHRLRLTNAGNGDPHDMVTDGRYVSWRTGPGTGVVIRDTRSRTNHSFNVPTGCEFREVYAARALLACNTMTPDSYVATVDIDGQDARVAGTYDPRRYSPGSLGKHWIVLGPVDRATVVLYLNWRTGERRETSARVDPHTDDLAPRAKPTPANPRLLRSSLSEKTPLRVLSGTKRLRLSECKTGCRRVQLAFGRVAWIEGATLRIVRMRDRRSWSARLSPATARLFNPYLLTKYEVIVDRFTGGDYQHLRARI